MRYTDPVGIREHVKKSADAAEKITKETHSHGVRDLNSSAENASTAEQHDAAANYHADMGDRGLGGTPAAVDRGQAHIIANYWHREAAAALRSGSLDAAARSAGARAASATAHSLYRK